MLQFLQSIDFGHAALCAASGLAGAGLVGVLAMWRIDAAARRLGDHEHRLRRLEADAKANGVERRSQRRAIAGVEGSLNTLAAILAGPFGLAEGGAAMACTDVPTPSAPGLGPRLSVYAGPYAGEFAHPDREDAGDADGRDAPGAGLGT